MSGTPVAVVTGASRGIGKAIAEELARTHAVVGTFLRTAPANAPEPTRAPGIYPFQCDVSSGDDRRRLVDQVRQYFGRLDLLVNNAGIAPRERRDVLEAGEDSFDELISTNLKGPHFLTQAFANLMRAQDSTAGVRARIVFVTSISVYTASVNRGEYCISKAGLSMSAALYAARLAAEEIPVFEIRPGIIQTDMTAPVAASYEERAARGLLPQRRIGQPAEVARAVRAIADGLLDYSTGQVIDV
ncbi:MAG: 3-ketoacyl-ACP reductase, partial [Bryobacteraceae bacterium]